MTHHPIRVLEDGTRVYSNGTKYRPKAAGERINAVRKPDVEGAQRMGGVWFLPLELAPMGERVLPATRPDTDAYDHMEKPRRCKCDVCRRPEAKRWKNQWRRERRQMRGASSASSSC